MTQMLDAKTGQVAEVPEADVSDALATGLYAFAPGQRVNIVDDSGRASSIDAAELPAALQGGYRIENAIEAQDRRFEKEYGQGVTSELKAGAEGVARTLTFGLSDQLLTKSGLSSSESLRERRNRNDSALAGEILGGVAPLLLSGGSSLLGQGIRAAGSGVRAASAAGRLAETSVARALGAESAIARVAAKAAGGAVEGAAFGAGQAITEAALGDTDVTAEKLLAGAGVGAVIGGSAAGLLGLGGEGVRLAGRKAGEAKGKITESIENLYRKATGNEPTKGLGEAYAKFSSVVSGGDEQAIKKLMTDKAARAVALSDDSALDAASRRLADIENESDEILDALAEKGRGIGKYEGIKGKVRADNVAEVFDASANVLNDFKATLDNMTTAAKESSEFELGAVNRAKKSFDKAMSRLGKFDVADPEANAKLFAAIDDLKRDVQKVVDRAGKSKRTSAAAFDTYETLKDAQEVLRTHLEDEILWGAAGAAQKEVNSKWVPFLGNERFAGNNFAVKVGEDTFEGVYKHDPGRYMSFFKQLTSPANDLNYQFLNNRQASRLDLLDALQRNFADDPALAAKVTRARELTKEAQSLMSKVKDDAVLKNQFRQLSSGNDVLGAGAGSVAGYLLGGPLGAAAGAVVGAASRPAQTIRQLAAIDRIQTNVSARIKNAVGDYFTKARNTIGTATRKAGEATREVGRRVSSAVTPLTVLQESHFGDATRARTVTDNRRDAAQQHARDIAEFVSDPMRAAERIGRATSSIANVAPSVAAAVGQKAMVAAQFLSSKAPKDPRPPNPLMTREWIAPERELAKFARYVEAVEDPMSVMERLSDGTLTRESVEALQVVYPSIYQELVGEVIAQMSETPATYAYADRVQLSLLLDQPLDPTMRPEFLAAAAARWAQGPQQPQQIAPARARVAGIEKLSLGQAMTPKTERVQEAMG